MFFWYDFCEEKNFWPENPSKNGWGFLVTPLAVSAPCVNKGKEKKEKRERREKGKKEKGEKAHTTMTNDN